MTKSKKLETTARSPTYDRRRQLTERFGLLPFFQPLLTDEVAEIGKRAEGIVIGFR
jgi:hypothetical protein